MSRRAGAWALLTAMSLGLGLGVAWLEGAFAIPKNVTAWLWIVLMVGALGFAGWAAWGYYRAIRDEEEWE
jgi:ammonia channel protein AmtB